MTKGALRRKEEDSLSMKPRVEEWATGRLMKGQEEKFFLKNAAIRKGEEYVDGWEGGNGTLASRAHQQSLANLPISLLGVIKKRFVQYTKRGEEGSPADR